MNGNTKKRQPLTDDQRALAGSPEAISLAQKMASNYATQKNCERHLEELESSAMEAICEAAARYTPERGEFLPFASVVIWGRLRDCSRGIGTGGFSRVSKAVRSGGLDRLLISTDALIADTPDAHGSQIPSDAPPVGWDLECEDAVRGATKELGAAGAAVRLILLRADMGGSVVRVAAHMGLSVSRVSQLLNLAVGDLCRRAGVPVPADRMGAFALRADDERVEAHRRRKSDYRRRRRDRATRAASEARS